MNQKTKVTEWNWQWFALGYMKFEDTISHSDDLKYKIDRVSIGLIIGTLSIVTMRKIDVII